MHVGYTCEVYSNDRRNLLVVECCGKTDVRTPKTARGSTEDIRAMHGNAGSDRNNLPSSDFSGNARPFRIPFAQTTLQ